MIHPYSSSQQICIKFKLISSFSGLQLFWSEDVCYCKIVESHVFAAQTSCDCLLKNTTAEAPRILTLWFFLFLVSSDDLVSAILNEPSLIITANVTAEVDADGDDHTPISLLQILDKNEKPSLKITWDLKRAKSKHLFLLWRHGQQQTFVCIFC